MNRHILHMQYYYTTVFPNVVPIAPRGAVGGRFQGGGRLGGNL